MVIVETKTRKRYKCNDMNDIMFVYNMLKDEGIEDDQMKVYEWGLEVWEENKRMIVKV